MNEENDLDIIFGGKEVEFDEASMLPPANKPKEQEEKKYTGHITTFGLKRGDGKKEFISFTIENPSIHMTTEYETIIKGKLVDWVESGLYQAILHNKFNIHQEDIYVSTIDGVKTDGFYIRDFFVNSKKVRMMIRR